MLGFYENRPWSIDLKEINLFERLSKETLVGHREWSWKEKESFEGVCMSRGFYNYHLEPWSVTVKEKQNKNIDRFAEAVSLWIVDATTNTGSLEDIRQTDV